MTVHKWIKELGFNYLTTNTHLLKNKIFCIKQRILDQSIQNQLCILRDNKKLQFFNKIYRFNKRPSYVDICRYKSDRSTICKFRVSAHSLAIERGRYKNIPVSDRICNSCQLTQVEDELHFFIYCPEYNNFRHAFINKIKKSIKNFNSLTENNINLIFNSNSYIVLKATIDYINHCQASSHS